MSHIRKLSLFIAGFVLRTSLFFGFTLLAAVMVFGNSENIKQALIDSDAYERFGKAVVDSGKQTKTAENTIPLEDVKVAEAVQASLNPASLQQIAETVIDSGYDWLEGDKQQFEFSVSLQQNKEILAKGISDYAIERLVMLDQCRQIPAETNIFKVPCYPGNLNLPQTRAEIYDAVKKDTSIFPGSELTEANLPKAGDGKSFNEAYAEMPGYYQWFKRSPWIILALSAISAAVLIKLYRFKKYGVRTVATSLLGTGVVLAITPLLYQYVLPATGFSLPGFGSGSSADQSFAAISNDVMANLYSQFNTALINVAIQVVTAGIVLYFISRFIKTPASRYAGIEEKAGLAVSIDNKPRNSGSPLTGEDIPIQSSEGSKAKRGRTSRLEKNYKKTYRK